MLVEISADLDALETIARNCDEAHRALAKPSRAVLAMAAVDVHRYSTAIENLLERIERGVGAAPAPGPAWHRELLLCASRALANARPAILSPETIPALERLLSLLLPTGVRRQFDPARRGVLAEEIGRIYARVVAPTCTASRPSSRRPPTL
ncbi:MAG: hypothetical protein IT457_07025 [Planctomycetes bacterium]|nr:hypothetical protein [Planctomycetota bacterium]